MPNFSLGRDQEAGRAIERHATGSGAVSLGRSLDADHNRMVLSLVASPLEPLLSGLLSAVALAARKLDLNLHRGVHPRVGVADVIPLIPLAEAGLEDSVAGAHALAERIWSELSIPVYLYGAAARRPESVRLASIRAGRSRPDLGGPDPHPSAGAVCVGARGLLVAYNVILPGADAAQAAVVAGRMRERSSGLPGLQALAFELSGGVQQLSMNLTRPELTPLPLVLGRVRELFPGAGPDEVVGLCPAVAAGPAARGKVLEVRMAAEAAAFAARRLEAAGEAKAAPAIELRAAAAALDTLDVGPGDWVTAAELAAGGRARLRSTGTAASDPALVMLDHAARRLRTAAGADAARLFPERLRSLDALISGS